MTILSSECVVCGSQASKGDGRLEQRRVCLECGYRSRRAGQEVGARMPLKRVFAEYLHDLSEGRADSLVAMSVRYQISESTSLRWRHRAMRLIGTHTDTFALLKGRVEADETYLPRGTPGTKGGSMGTPRVRGSRRVRGASKQGSVAVVTAVERQSGRVYLRVMSGGTTKAMLEAMSGALASRSRLISDGYKSYITLAKQENLRHTRLIVSRRSRSIGWRHLNTVNSLHARIRLFFAPFRGVHQRTIHGYLAWFQLREERHIASWLGSVATQLGWSPCPTCGR